jgi:hypothetical protein
VIEGSDEQRGRVRVGNEEEEKKERTAVVCGENDHQDLLHKMMISSLIPSFFFCVRLFQLEIFQ